MIYLDLIQGIRGKMFCRLLQIADSACVAVKLNDRVQTIRGQRTLILFHSDPFQNFRERISGEDHLLLFRCVIRDLDDREPGHKRSADLVFLIRCCDRIHAHCRDHAFDIIVCKSKIIQQSQKHIRRIPVAFSRRRLVQLIDNKHQIGLSCHGECVHNNSRFCICVDSGASGQLFRVINGTHIKCCPRQLQNACYRIGNLGFSGSRRSDQQQSICRKRMSPVDLNNRFDDSLFHGLHAVKFLVQYPACLVRINGREIIALPLNIHHNGECSLSMPAFFRRYLMGAGHRQISPCPETDVVRQCPPCAGHEIRNALYAGQLHTVPGFIFIFVRDFLGWSVT